MNPMNLTGWSAALCLSAVIAQAQQTNETSSAGGTNVVKLPTTTVVGKLDVAREQIVPELGATVYSVDKAQIAALPGGENASLNQVLEYTPGMAKDSAVNGDLHLRGEHANIQYRINDVLLPEGITGFGLELDPRFVDSLHLITGSLPAQYGFRTAGIVDIHTKSGAFEPGGVASLYGGSYETIKPSIEYGGSKGNLNFFADASYTHSSLGIENTTASSTPIHDRTDQYKGFTYWSSILDDTSRISLIGSASYSDFQVPDIAGLPPGTPTVPGGVTAVPWATYMPASQTNFNSATENERQNEQAYYAVAAYQKSAGDFNGQLAAFARDSSVHFRPDPVGDLWINGVASDVNRRLYSAGLEMDASYNLGDKHTIRAGFTLLDEVLSSHTSTTVFPTDSNGNPTNAPFNIGDNSVPHAFFLGLYLQDEWKVLKQLTINYGARFDLYWASFDEENQPSPRINAIYTPTDSTTLHAGYARYFTPPPLENVPVSSVHKSDNTSNASATDQDDGVKAERADYIDAGISQKLLPGLTVGVDAYYKWAQNQIDDGLFGQTLILSAFNYRLGRVHGVEFTSSYVNGGFAAYANIAWSEAQGKEWNSAEFLFSPDDAAYVKNHWIHLDHDQTVSVTTGLSYLWSRSVGSTRAYVDALFGSGLRTDLIAPIRMIKIPNGRSVPDYYTVGMGLEEKFKIRGKDRLLARLDVVNVTDNPYQLRNGSGVGVNAPQFGMRLGFFGTVGFMF